MWLPLPFLSGSLLLDAIGDSIVANGTSVYVAAGEKGILTVNCATASAPVVSATNAVPGFAACVAVNGKIACLADGFSGFQTLKYCQSDDSCFIG